MPLAPDLFPAGLQNINWIPKADPDPSTDFDVIQPVLQYPANDGYSWSARSWYVTFRDGALASTEISMSEGDLVFGNMTRTGDQSWDVISTNTRTGKSTVQSATNARLQSQPWGYNTLECYGCQGCGTFPQKPSGRRPAGQGRLGHHARQACVTDVQG